MYHTIYRPVQSNRITQHFNENEVCIAGKDKRAKFPPRYVNARQGTCPDGFIPLYKTFNMKGHNGLDLATWHGEKLFHSHKANTTWTAKGASDNSGGLGVDIISDEPLYFSRLPKFVGPEATQLWERQKGFLRVKHRYWHLKSVAVQDGQKVSHGDLIGYCDNTGASTGDHLHWGFKFVDANGKTLDNTNGYYGAVDHEPWFVNHFIIDIIRRENAGENTLTREQRQALFDVIKSLLTEVKTDISTTRENIRRALGL